VEANTFFHFSKSGMGNGGILRQEMAECWKHCFRAMRKIVACGKSKNSARSEKILQNCIFLIRRAFRFKAKILRTLSTGWQHWPGKEEERGHLSPLFCDSHLMPFHPWPKMPPLINGYRQS
jgi:hypothetical protein